jgi:TonB family protein
VFTGTKESIDGAGFPGTRSYRTAAFAIACSATLHWAVAQWLTIAVGALQLPAMGIPGAVIKAIINSPESATGNRDSTSEDASLKTPTIGKLTEVPVESEDERTPVKVNLNTSQPKYFGSREVDIAATPTFTPPLLFPERAFISKLSGKVLIQVFINEAGTVDSAIALETIPTHQPFTDSAITTVQNTIFSPAMREGRKVKSQKLIEVIFNAEEDKLKD